MNISVKRTGGFAGLTEEVASLNTATLDATASRQIEQLVKNIGFFALPAKVVSQAIGADYFSYEITISEGARHHTVTFVDDESPETASLHGFVDSLKTLQHP